MDIGKSLLLKIRRNVNGNVWDVIRAEVNNLVNVSMFYSDDGPTMSGHITHSMVEECYYSVFESVNTWVWYGNR